MKNEPPVEDKAIHHGCACCGGTKKIASLSEPVFADDGQITKDGVQVWPPISFSANPADWFKSIDAEGYPVTKPLSEFEEMAKQEPNADWRYTFVKALRDGVYQRQAEGKWVLIRSGKGYA